MSYRDSISGIGIIVKRRESLPLGNGDRGRFVPPENGRRSIFVPSYGTMDKEEVDYVVEAAQEQEDERLKRGDSSPTKKKLGYVAEAAIRAPRGQRAKTAQEAIEELG